MEVKLEKFSGPLELLLQLIEERRLEVTEVSLAEVTDQYIEYVRTSEIMMEEMADFLVVASKLLLIKSRALLPSLELSRSEEEEIHDFTLQLQEYQRYREAMQAIQQFVRSDQFIYTRPAWSGLQLGFFPPSHLEVKELG
ncbi:MAG: segregation/condensation protein A, partial [Parcubacteria group bacterium]|nr:segregation/condensation protein A [Parcubacteria group bacterium]